MIQAFFVLLRLYKIFSACLYNEIPRNPCLVSLSCEERNRSWRYIQDSQRLLQTSVNISMHFALEIQ